MAGSIDDIEGPFSGGTGHILPAELERASFRVIDMTHKLDGGESKTRRRRWIVEQSSGMELGLERYHMTREQLLARHVKDFIDIHAGFGRRMAEGKFKISREDIAWMSEHAMNSGPFWDHYVPFLTALQGQASDAQYTEWGSRAAKFQIIGTYAQTELGHGSNVRGLRTKATLDVETDEWVLETPTLTAIKWWPGGMAKLATHAIVYAQLHLHGRSYGVHSFMLQLRDEEHGLLPGIELGELGPKMGDAGHDSGCLRLCGARIPRGHLLERYQHVTRDGQYVKALAAEQPAVPTHYSSMLLTRASWVQLAGGQLAKACTIAVRYSAVRQQGFLGPPGASAEGRERQLLDYTVQRRRLLVQTAAAYAVKFAARGLLERVAVLEDPHLPLEDRAKLMPALAAESGCLKALATLMAADGIEDLRRCCGGNGYLLSSGIAALALDDLWHVTAEGDYIVLLLASARFFVKRNASAGTSDTKSGQMRSVGDWMDASKVLAEVQRLADLSMDAAVAAVTAARAGGQSDEDSFNSAAEQLVASASWRGRALMLGALWQQCETLPTGAQCPPAVTAVLHSLAALFGCHIVASHGGVELPVGGGQHLSTAIQQLCAQLRDEAVALVESFDYEDRVLNSTLGVRSGRVYEALFEASRRSAQDFQEPFRGYKEVLQPLLDTDYLKRGASIARSKL